MNLEDLLIMEVPRRALQYVTSDNKLKPGGTAVEDYARVIANNIVTRPIGEALAENYRYAGQTAVSLYKPLNGVPLELSQEKSLKSFLLGKYGEELFSEQGIKAELSAKPKLYKIQEYENKWIVSLTFLGREIRVIRNYQLEKERPQYVDFIVLHFNPFLIEMRVAATKVPLFQEAFKNILDIAKEIDWFNLSKLSTVEARELKEVLGGGVTGAKHKMTEGIYDTVEVKAIEDVEDLFGEPEYQDSFSGTPFKSITFRFLYKHSIGLEESISMRITPSAGMYDSVCPPPEEAGFFLRVKGLQGKDMMGPGREGRGE